MISLFVVVFAPKISMRMLWIQPWWTPSKRVFFWQCTQKFHVCVCDSVLCVCVCVCVCVCMYVHVALAKFLTESREANTYLMNSIKNTIKIQQRLWISYPLTSWFLPSSSSRRSWWSIHPGWGWRLPQVQHDEWCQVHDASHTHHTSTSLQWHP